MDSYFDETKYFNEFGVSDAAERDCQRSRAQEIAEEEDRRFLAELENFPPPTEMINPLACTREEWAKHTERLAHDICSVQPMTVSPKELEFLIDLDYVREAPWFPEFVDFVGCIRGRDEISRTNVVHEIMQKAYFDLREISEMIGIPIVVQKKRVNANGDIFLLAPSVPVHEEPRRTCACDIRDLMSVGHDDTCPERKR